MNNDITLITGATSGIGYELAHVFASNGHNLVIVARDEGELQSVKEDLEELYDIEVWCIAKDLSEPSAAEEVYNQVMSMNLEIDILVNDAGQGVYGRFTDTDLREEIDIIQLNVVALVTLTKLFLKGMVARNSGRILQLASLVSKIPSPLMAVYAGTKAFVYNFSQSLANELADTGVTVTTLQPGPTDTDFFNKAGAENAKVVREGDLADPADVAADAYKALLKGERKVVSGTKNKFMDTVANITSDEKLAEEMHKQNE